jgi:hypothetical protein
MTPIFGTVGLTLLFAAGLSAAPTDDGVVTETARAARHVSLPVASQNL